MTGWSQRSRIEAGVGCVLVVASIVMAVDAVIDSLATMQKRRAYAAFATHSQRPKSSLATLLKAIERLPDDRGLLSRLGVAYLKLGEFKRANQVYRDLEALGGDAGALGALGRAVVTLEHRRADKRHAEVAAERDPERAAERETEREQVRRLIAQGKAAYPFAARSLRAAMLAEEGQAGQAREILKKALAIRAPSGRWALVTAYANLAAIETAANDHRAASQHLASCVHLVPERQDLIDRHAEAIARWTSTGDPDDPDHQAVLNSARALLTRPGRGLSLPYHLDRAHISLIRRGIGVGEARAGRLDKAIPSLHLASSKAPKTADESGQPKLYMSATRDLAAAFLMAMTAEAGDQGKRRHAANAGKYLLRIGFEVSDSAPEEAFSHFIAAARCFQAAVAPSDALKALRRAEKLRAVDPRVALGYATLYDSWSRGHRRKALPWYRKALAAAPEHSLSTVIAERIRTLELEK